MAPTTANHLSTFVLTASEYSWWDCLQRDRLWCLDGIHFRCSAKLHTLGAELLVRHTPCLPVVQYTIIYSLIIYGIDGKRWIWYKLYLTIITTSWTKMKVRHSLQQIIVANGEAQFPSYIGCNRLHEGSVSLLYPIEVCCMAMVLHTSWNALGYKRREILSFIRSMMKTAHTYYFCCIEVHERANKRRIPTTEVRKSHELAN